MRFIAVRLYTNKGDGETCCSFCYHPITDAYVRDLQTALVYHNLYCMESHVASSILCIEDAVRHSI